ncbi:MAG: hypothetical protein WC100_19330 [Sterolibacterium sp.]
MDDYRTTKELAEDAFQKRELLKAHEAMNTPLDFDERKSTFVALAEAREAASKANAALNARVGELEHSVREMNDVG